MLGQPFGGQRARVSRRDGDEPGGEGDEVGEHRAVVLVGHAAVQEGDLPARQVVAKRLHQRVEALRVVAAVDDEQRVAREQLEPARPANRGKPLADGGFGDLPALCGEHLQRGQHSARVVQLMLAQQRNVQPAKRFPVEHLSVKPVRDERQRLHASAVQPRAVLSARLLEHGLDRGLLRVEHTVAAVLDDAGLRVGDLLHRIAEHLHVVEPDVDDDRRLGRRDDVGGIELAAQADFEHYDVARMARKILHRDAGDQLEFGRVFVEGVGQRLDAGRDLGQLAVGNGFVVDLHPLVEANDVRRGVQPRAVARGAEHVGQHRGGRSLAVRAGDVDEFELFLRVSHARKQRAGAAEAGDGAHPRYAVDVG